MLIGVAPLFIAGASLAIQAASATPIHGIVVSSHIEVIPDHVNIGPASPEGMVFRVGLAGAGATPATPMPDMRTGKGCAGKMHGKALELSNSLRQMFGLSTIEEPTAKWHTAVMPYDPKMVNLHPEDQSGDIRTAYLPHPRPMRYGMHPELEGYSELDGYPELNVYPEPEFIVIDEEPGFMERIHAALVELGTWEARAVAFVLGCGIGVLMRMVWIFVVLLMRELSPSREEPTTSVEEVRELAPTDDELPEYTDDVKAPAYTDRKTAMT